MPPNEQEASRESIVIQNVLPELDCGRFKIKRIVGDTLDVSADILKPGHDVLRAHLLHRKRGSKDWSRTPMNFAYDEDTWNASFSLLEAGDYEYAIEAWVDRYLTKIQDIAKWIDSREDVSSDYEIVENMIELAISESSGVAKRELSDTLHRIKEARDSKVKLGFASDPRFAELVNNNLEKQGRVTTEIFGVLVDPKIARFGTWYEMFHRSQGRIPGESATFNDCETRLPEIQSMGFDVIYLPPIHPIGRTNRRGPNNTPDPPLNAPGSPWAIGSEIGGHMSINPDLGTMNEFLHFVESARKLGIETALDMTFQCSPDHPYVKEHPDWFLHRPDGSIRFAENPPKKYYDVIPFFFENKDWKALYDELLKIVMFWVEKGIKIFRVDNPHTKPIGFWEWLISSVKASNPEVIFLAEAFTRPKEMKLLAKAGFSQSYTYFTWKNTKEELEEFLKEFFISDASEYYRGNLFTNTPDILSGFLLNARPSAFKIRLVLAATLGSSYGIYNGFELCENRSRSRDSEEYLNSEKYEYRVWDWDRPGNIKDYISKINKIRKENPALQFSNNIHLLQSSNEKIIFYGKWTEDKKNVILVAVNLDPNNVQDSTVFVPAEELGLAEKYRVRDLITGARYDWKIGTNYVRLEPNVEACHIFLIEQDADANI